MVKVNDALEGLTNAVKYLQQNGLDFVIMKMLNSLKHQILGNNIETSASLVLDETKFLFCGMQWNNSVVYMGSNLEEESHPSRQVVLCH